MENEFRQVYPYTQPLSALAAAATVGMTGTAFAVYYYFQTPHWSESRPLWLIAILVALAVSVFFTYQYLRMSRTMPIVSLHPTSLSAPRSVWYGKNLLIDYREINGLEIKYVNQSEKRFIVVRSEKRNELKIHEAIIGKENFEECWGILELMAGKSSPLTHKLISTRPRLCSICQGVVAACDNTNGMCPSCDQLNASDFRFYGVAAIAIGCLAMVIAAVIVYQTSATEIFILIPVGLGFGGVAAIFAGLEMLVTGRISKTVFLLLRPKIKS